MKTRGKREDRANIIKVFFLKAGITPKTGEVGGMDEEREIVKKRTLRCFHRRNPIRNFPKMPLTSRVPHGCSF